MHARLKTMDPEVRWWVILGLLAGLVAVPLVTASPGNDLDVGNIFRSGRGIVRHFTYIPSRPPGSPVHETIVGVGDLLGGPVLTNLATVAAAVGAIWSLHALLRGEGLGRTGRWGVALVVANPWFIVAATSTADYVFALAFVLGAAVALRRDHALVAAVLAAAAMGSRVGSVTLLLALVVAELGEGREAWRRVASMCALASALTAAVFIPSVLHAGGISFAQNDFSTSSPLVQVGRALAKDLLLLGVPTALIMTAALPAVLTVIRRWRVSWLIRFSLTGLLASQLLFIRFPWKMAHLLPTLVCLAVLYAVALQDRPRVLMAMVALQALFAVVRVDVIQPNDPNRATGAELSPSLSWGPVIEDLQCRQDHPDAYLGRQKIEVEAAWVCAEPFDG